MAADPCAAVIPSAQGSSTRGGTKVSGVVTPAKAGVYCESEIQWIPAFAGITHRARFSSECNKGSHRDFGKHKPFLETEIKLPVSDHNWVENRLTQLGYKVVKPRHFESNYLFDFPDFAWASPGGCCVCDSQRVRTC